MNHPPSSPDSTVPTPTALDVLETRFALRVTARLNETSQMLEPDIGERLRFAREQALERARALRRARENAPIVRAASAAAQLGRAGSNWWFKLAATLPVIALVSGLILIQDSQTDTQIAAAAEVDTALLSDNLPPDAYGDAGFAEFLKVSTE
ncbi:MAG: DUF3619 family protein [Burkholderiaceae bacterium]